MIKKGMVTKAWNCIYPLGVYYVSVVTAMFVARMVFGADNEHYMLCQIIATLFTLPVIYPIYRQDCQLQGRKTGKECFQKESVFGVFWAIITAAFVGVGLNNIIGMSPLMNSIGYKEASEAFYGGNFWLQIIGSALLTPLLEEVLYRGIIFQRIRWFFGKVPGLLCGSLIFALMHFNIVQFIYAFLLGLIFCIFVEKEDSVYPAILAHISANLIAVIRTETGFLDFLIDGSLVAWVGSCLCLLLGIVSLVLYLKMKEKK